MRLALVLWNGNLGGAETFSAALARQLRADGVDAGLVFVGSPEPLARELDDVPHVTIGLGRGREVLLRPLALARATREVGPDGALVVSPGYLPATLRLGRYRGPIVVVNHGAFMHDDEASAFAAQVAALGAGTTLLIDTYDVESAVRAAVDTAGPALGAVRIDSGDLVALAKSQGRWD